jgi:hypothetical protein
MISEEKNHFFNNFFSNEIQQILEQIQDINQQMQSMDVRPSSRKRKNNTQNDVGQARKINKVAPNHQEGSTSAKATMTCFKFGYAGHFANRCPKTEEIESAIIVVRGVTMLINAPTRKPRKRREYIQKIEDGYDSDLDGYYAED